MNSSNRHVEILDYVRAVAILLVFSFHALASTFEYDVLPWNGWLRDFSVPPSFICLLPFSFAGVGVALFFVVSGFCIHLSFQRLGRDWRSFWIRRFFRIYPAYVAAIAFSVICLVANKQTNLHNWPIWKEILTNLFLVQNVNPAATLNGSFWSLAVEVQLYLLYPLLLFLISKLGWKATVITLALCEISLRAANGVFDTLNADTAVWGRVIYILGQSPLGYWFSWTLGALVAESFLKNRPFPLAKVPAMPCVFLLFASYFVRPILPLMFPLAALTTAIVVSRILNRGGEGIRLPDLLSGLLKKVALWSYSIYLLHQPILFNYCLVIGWLFPKENVLHFVTFLLVAATALIIIPISGLCYKAVEFPGINFGRHLIDRKIRPLPPHSRPYLNFCAFSIAVIVTVFIGAQYVKLGIQNEIDLALVETSKDDFPAALKHYYRALQMDRDSVIALNNVAWIMATAPDPQVQNGKMAVALATRACILTSYNNPETLCTLAAADADAGLFQDAVANAQKAHDSAAAQGLADVAAKNGQLIELFKAGKVFRESYRPYQGQSVKIN